MDPNRARERGEELRRRMAEFEERLSLPNRPFADRLKAAQGKESPPAETCRRALFEEALGASRESDREMDR